MLEIGNTTFVLDVPALAKDELQRYTLSVFEEWEVIAEGYLPFPDYSLYLEIKEGSLKGRGKIATAAAALYFGIGAYGSFVTGLETIHRQASYVGDSLFQKAQYKANCDSRDATVRKHTGVVSGLRSLFVKVQSRSISVTEAMEVAVKLLGDEAQSNPEFINELRIQLQNVPLDPEQMDLLDDEPNDCEQNDDPMSSQVPRPKPTPNPRPRPKSSRYTIEVYRESKENKKHVKVKLK